MAAPGLTIPTSFTATGNYAANVNRMATSTDRLLGSLNRINRAAGLGDMTKNMLSFAKSALLVGGAFAAANFSVKSIMDYETAIASLSAITGTSGEQLGVFKTKVMEVAKATGTSSVEVAKAFTAVGNNAPELLKDAAGLAEVSKQAIILAQASKMELGPSADYLTSIMNQFSTPASQAGKTIGMLALGAQLGSIDINNVSDAMQKFGGVASQVAGVSMQESIAAIESISAKMKDSEKIGTQFKQVFLRMSSLSVQDPKALKDMMRVGLNIKLIENKATPLIERLKELRKLMGVKGGLEHVFGTENVQALIPLLTETDKFADIMGHLNSEIEVGSAATTMAAKNNNTLAMTVDRLKNKFANWVIVSSESGGVLDKVKHSLFWVTENMEGLIKGVGITVGALVAFKTAVLLVRGALFAYNIVMGVLAVTSATTAVSIGGGTTAMIAQKVASYAVIAAQWAWNASLLACPLLLIVGGVALLAAGVYYLNQQLKETVELNQKAFQRGANKASANVQQRIANGETKQEAIANEKMSVSRQQKENQFQVDQEMKMGGLFADKAKLKKLGEEQSLLRQQMTNLGGMESGKLSVGGKNIMAPSQVDAITGKTYANANEKAFMAEKAPSNVADQFSLQRQEAVNPSAPQYPDGKMEIVIKNDGSSQVDVKSGKTQAKSVMPNTKSSFNP